MDAESKEEYSLLAAQDKERFEREMKAYRQTVTANSQNQPKIQNSINSGESACSDDPNENGERSLNVVSKAESISSDEDVEDSEELQDNETNKHEAKIESRRDNWPTFIIQRIPQKAAKSEVESEVESEVIKLEQEKEEVVESQPICNTEPAQADNAVQSEANDISYNDTYESIEEDSQICNGPYYEFEQELEEEDSNTLLPFLNQPRSSYKSLLDYRLECYLQWRYQACPYISPSTAIPLK